jgi:predicted MFS family arabinose efflux permease
MLCLGYFVCGFQIIFISLHIPAYLQDRGMSLGVGTMVLALIGLANVGGTYLCGALGGKYGKPQLLAGLYGLRGLFILVFLLVPLSEYSAYAFGIAMGFTWLGTVPLTTGTVASIFGIRNMSMLAGIAFLFHQVGAFFGGWLGGYIFDATGSYDVVWMIAIGLSVWAFAMNWPIKEVPVTRLAASQG